jgi:hypothetical protein
MEVRVGIVRRTQEVVTKNAQQMQSGTHIGQQLDLERIAGQPYDPQRS